MSDIYTLTSEIIALIYAKDRFRATINKLINHTETDSKRDEIELDFEIIGLPQHRVIAVRNVEPIVICIGEEDDMPCVRVRNDFPVVPHLNILEDNITKTLCYVDLQYNEIKHKMSGRFLLTCIENWFLKTSRNELHQANQPLEPFFPYSNNVIVLDEQIINIIDKYMVEDREFGKLMYRCDNGKKYIVINLSVSRDYSNLIHNMPKTLFDLLQSFGNKTIIEERLKDISSIIRNPKEYRKYFGQSKQILLASNVIIKLMIPKSRTIDATPESYDFRTFVSEKPLRDIIDDYGFVLNGSKFEGNNKLGEKGKNIPIQHFNVHFNNLKIHNKLYNSLDLEDGNENISIIGVGALGSHILNNFLREGYGKWTIIDNDYFWPHNIARHVLTNENIGYRKADSLSLLSKRIQADSDIEVITEDFFCKSSSICNSLERADIIIDTSTSIAVERILALDIKSRARKLSCFLNPRGTATIMLLEDSAHKVRLDLLEMQYYREVLSNEKFKNHMMLPMTKVYSGGCRNITSRISQDDVSLSASLCSKAIKLHLKEPNGKVIIWTHEDDSVSRVVFPADSWYVYYYNKWIIEIPESLLEDIKSDRVRQLPNETGGVLIGAFDLSRKRVYIVHQLKAPKDSIASPNSFIRGCVNLPEQLKSIYETTSGNLSYIGEWHSHSNDNTKKSRDDEVLHSEIVKYNRENCIPGCMMIMGEKDCSIYVDE